MPDPPRLSEECDGIDKAAPCQRCYLGRHLGLGSCTHRYWSELGRARYVASVRDSPGRDGRRHRLVDIRPGEACEIRREQRASGDDRRKPYSDTRAGLANRRPASRSRLRRTGRRNRCPTVPGPVRSALVHRAPRRQADLGGRGPNLLPCRESVAVSDEGHNL